MSTAVIIKKYLLIFHQTTKIIGIMKRNKNHNANIRVLIVLATKSRVTKPTKNIAENMKYVATKAIFDGIDWNELNIK